MHLKFGRAPRVTSRRDEAFRGGDNLPVVEPWNYIINGDALRVLIQPWPPSETAGLGDLHSRAVQSPRPLGTQCPQSVGQRSHMRARWPARPGQSSRSRELAGRAEQTDCRRSTLADLQPQATHRERAAPAERTSARCSSTDIALKLLGGGSKPSRSSMTACFRHSYSHTKSKHGIRHEHAQYSAGRRMPRDSFAGASAFLQA